jgi:hypothetical protein
VDELLRIVPELAPCFRSASEREPLARVLNE